jgi:hypothetical protein
MNDAVSVKLREIVIGPHPSWQIRATYVAFAYPIARQTASAGPGARSLERDRVPLARLGDPHVQLLLGVAGGDELVEPLV